MLMHGIVAAAGRAWPPFALVEASDRIMIGSRTGIVRDVEPLVGEHELRLVVQLTGDEFSC